nr:hypothetical protein Iba_chr06bCG4020 [Ipomoea batatas]
MIESNSKPYVNGIEGTCIVPASELWSIPGKRGNNLGRKQNSKYKLTLLKLKMGELAVSSRAEGCSPMLRRRFSFFFCLFTGNAGAELTGGAA